MLSSQKADYQEHAKEESRTQANGITFMLVLILNFYSVESFKIFEFRVYLHIAY